MPWHRSPKCRETHYRTLISECNPMTRPGRGSCVTQPPPTRGQGMIRASSHHAATVHAVHRLPLGHSSGDTARAARGHRDNRCLDGGSPCRRGGRERCGAIQSAHGHRRSPTSATYAADRHGSCAANTTNATDRDGTAAAASTTDCKHSPFKHDRKRYFAGSDSEAAPKAPTPRPQASLVQTPVASRRDPGSRCAITAKAIVMLRQALPLSRRSTARASRKGASSSSR